ncbi:MAG: glycosyltransferase, partial [Desulfatiglans sp.]|nr:glycosyltransferase [Desulfatiglans sp.]
MKIDLHVHSKYSKRPSEWILKKLGCPESFTEPLDIYSIARERGMTHVTISDHNSIEGALEIAHLPGVIISEEVTTYFPEEGCKAHVLAVNISEKQHIEIQKAREDIFDLVTYFHQENIFHILAHQLYPVNDRLTVDHVEKCLLLFKNFELNGARNNRENSCLIEIVKLLNRETINRLSEKHQYAPLIQSPEQKILFAGSDDHSSLNIARSYTELDMDEISLLTLRDMEGRLPTVHSRHASPKTMAHNIYSIAWQFYKNRLHLQKYAAKDPLIRFLDQSLFVGCNGNHSIRSKMYSLWAARNYRKQKQPISESLTDLLRFEANRLIRENRDIMQRDTKASSFEEGREERWFNWIQQLSSRLMIHFSDHLMDHVSGANVFSIFHTIGSAGGLYTLLAPYFIAYSQFSKGRELGESVRRSVSQQQSPRYGEAHSERVKIAHLTDTLYEINGVAKTLQQQARLAAENNKDYTLITCDQDSLGDQRGVKKFEPIGTYELPEYPELKIFYPPLLDMLDYCQRKGFNQIQSSTPGPLGLAALAIARILKLPISGTYHTAIPQYVQILTGSRFMEELSWKFILWYYDQLDTIYVPSKSTENELLEKGIHGDKIKVYPRGIDIEQFHPSKRNGFFKPFFNADERIKFLYVGRVSKEKNLDLLVNAFKRLSGLSRVAHLTVVGDGPYLEEMKNDLNDFPCLFTGYLEGEALPAAYASSDVFVFPSTTDTFGNVVLEAQASGLPVIVTDQGGPCENMIPEKTGFLVHGGSQESLFQAMKVYADDISIAQKMSKAARA